MPARRTRGLLLALLGFIAVVAPVAARAQVTPIDLDAVAANGRESQCELAVDTSGPVVTFINRVVNRTADEFDFSWPSAGPGGLIGHFPAANPPTSLSKTVEWHWTTTRNVIGFQGTSCATDLCFGETVGPDPMTGSVCSLACLEDGITLTPQLDRSSGAVVLSWTGGTGPFNVFRAPRAPGLVDLDRMPSVNALLQNSAPTQLPPTAVSPFSDVPPAGGIYFYEVRGTSCRLPKACSTDANCSLPGDGFCISRGPFGVPGRSWFGGNVAVVVSQGTLTTTFLQTFSPTIAVFHAESTAGAGGVLETYSSNSGSSIDVTTPGLPQGCCPAKDGLHQMDCHGTCVSYLDDIHNCGACGNECRDEESCDNGVCTLHCGEGQIACGGECVYCDLADSCCIDGACVSACNKGWSLCGDTCYDTANDSGHCGSCDNKCGPDSCCQSGECTTLQCGDESNACADGTCPDFSADDQNCGSCGTQCTPGTCCFEGYCSSICDKGQTYCDGECTYLDDDDLNCGACGNACSETQCCVYGECTPLDEGGYCPGGKLHAGGSTTVLGACPPYQPPTPGICPNSTAPGSPAPSLCAGDDGGSAFGGPPPNISPDEAPLCTVDPKTTTVPGDGTPVQICHPGGVLFTEVPSSVRVCGGGIPGVDGDCSGSASKVASGTFNRFFPVSGTPDALVTPYGIHVVSDPSGDGLLQPGEQGSLVVDVLNAGPVDITGATATLAGPAIDLTGDGIANPVALTVASSSQPVSFGTIQGTPAATDCIAPPLHVASGGRPFVVTVPPEHPGNTARPLTLTVTGKVNGETRTFSVPLSLGIGGKCECDDHDDHDDTGCSSDGLVGLYPPMAKLVPNTEPVQFPARALKAGDNRLLKLDVTCGGAVLPGWGVNPPEIVGLTKNGTAIDLTTLYETDTHQYTTLFHWYEDLIDLANKHWLYDLRTSTLGTGTFVITIRMPGRRQYVSGFVLQ